jgi:hypothetical protein
VSFGLDYDAKLLARTKRNHDAIAHLRALLARLRIIEKLVERYVERDPRT